jgi:hypothetical protein
VKLENKYFGKDLIAAVNRWSPGTKATSTFLNDCAASSDFLWAPPEQGSGKWKKYNDIHLLEFGMQCVFKAMSLPRETAKLIVKELRKGTSYHKSKSKRELDERLSSYMLIIKNSKYFESVRDIDAIKKVIQGESGVLTKRKPLGANGPASHALILVPEVILRGLVD